MLLPAPVLGASLPAGKPSNIHHEDPGESVNAHPTHFDNQRRLWRGQFTVQHSAANADPHRGKQENEEQVHRISSQTVIAAHALEEPAGLQERIGDLTAEEDSAGLDARLAKSQRQHYSKDAHGVVGQHHQTLSAEIHTPSHVKEEVSQAENKSQDLERRVLSAWQKEQKSDPLYLNHSLSGNAFN